MAAINVSVRSRPRESAERLIRRFIKKCKKEKVVERYRERTDHHIKPSVKRKLKQKKAARRRMLEERRRQKFKKRAKYRR